MTWFRADDTLESHPKVRAIPRRQRFAAMGLWTLAGTWCARHLTDGRISASECAELGAPSSLVRALVEARLWVETAPGVYQFHDWEDWQPTREKVTKRRQDSAARQAAWRERAGQRRASGGRDGDETGNGDASVTRDERVSDASTDGHVTRESQSPDPTRPDPTRPDRSSFGTTGGGGDRPATPPGPPPTPRTRPPARCARHLLDLDPPACRACADARRAADAWQPPTPTPSTPECPLHAGYPTGSKQCPRCAERATPPPPNLRAALHRTTTTDTEEEPPW